MQAKTNLSPLVKRTESLVYSKIVQSSVSKLDNFVPNARLPPRSMSVKVCSFMFFIPFYERLSNNLIVKVIYLESVNLTITCVGI